MSRILVMKLLIVTQAVDQNDPILGFFCRWLETFSKEYAQIEVICLKEGEHHLPANIRVHSLGKENGRAGRFTYAVRFKRLAWQLRHEYDAVFVHMNPEYVIIGGLTWKLLGKRIVFWYNHPKAGLRFTLAARLADKLCYTSPQAASASYPKATQMPVGIDTELFKAPAAPRPTNAIYMQGRIMPSKRVHVLLLALRLLREKGVMATVDLVGPEDEQYGETLRTDYADLMAAGAVSFVGSKRNEDTPTLFGAHTVAVNLASAGHFDKSVFEAMATETPVVVGSVSFEGLVRTSRVVPEDDPQALAEALEAVLASSEDERAREGEALRAAVIKEHSLLKLSEKLKYEITH